MRKKVTNPRPGSHTIDLTNMTFGKLTAISLHGLDKYKNKIWSCQCECGNIRMVITTYLTSGKTTSCGCASIIRKGNQIHNYSGYKDITGTKWNSIVMNAKSRQLEFDITKEYVWQLFEQQKRKCYFSGMPISYIDGTASIDRLNSAFGYVKDNIVLTHKDINRSKNAFSAAYYIYMCQKVADHTRNKNA